jgi:heme exporter protein CcmD
MPNLELGKYAFYIWPPYIVSALVIGGLTLDTLLRARRWKREVDRRELGRREADRDQKAGS